MKIGKILNKINEGKRPIVAVTKSDFESLYFKLNKIVDLLGGLQIDNKHVVIKINLCDARTPETGAITHPLVLEALLRLLRERYENLKISVVESDATVVLANDFIKWFGFEGVLKKWEAKFINLSEIESEKIKLDGKRIKELAIPKLLIDNIFFISLAKLKTNILTKISCSLKNQFGCLPDVEKSIYHPFLDEVIAEINYLIKPNFSLVDGIIAMGGAQGPAYGIPIRANLIIGGKDPVAVDAYCARLIGFSPYLVGHIRKSFEKGIGSMKYEVVGEKIASLNFEVNKFEMILFRWGSNLKRKLTKNYRNN
ncbi:MAG: DUF362 domain-containing protein [Candidatus Aminicenantes bacterium]|nr:DUF362 domain-containing protein [Candidatus Aminicenantes bacterium]